MFWSSCKGDIKMKICYYDNAVILEPESQAEKMQIDTLFSNMTKEKPSFSYELRHTPHSLVLELVKQ